MGSDLSLDEQTAITTNISIVTSAISLVADIFIIFGYLKFGELKKLAFTFVFYIACADFCRSCAQTWGAPEGAFVCGLQSWLQTLGGVAMFLWFAIIAGVCLSIKKVSEWWKTKTPADITRIKYILLATVAATSVILATIPWIADQYVNTGAWCWISSDAPGMRYGCYYGWLFLCLLFTIFVYIELFRMLRVEATLLKTQNDETLKQPNGSDNAYHDDQSREASQSESRKASSAAKEQLNTRKKQKRMFDHMRLYPLALILGQGAGSIRRCIELGGSDPGFGFAVAHAFFSGLFGTFTALIYGTKAWHIYRAKIAACTARKHGHGDDGGGGGGAGDEYGDANDERTQTQEDIEMQETQVR